ncbi:MAG: hypothetical protein JST71_06110 [Bacteroidetes bacterium]|nr:hypothetical protein [Bacteroidota bacterium]
MRYLFYLVRAFAFLMIMVFMLFLALFKKMFSVFPVSNKKYLLNKRIDGNLNLLMRYKNRNSWLVN